jgi:maltose alpha-D-glucosyltransferase/alpha-amylase
MGDNVYLGDRDGVRTPMQWSADRNAGFSRADFAQLYFPLIMDPVYGYQAVNVEAQQRYSTSLLNWVREMIHLRKQHGFLVADPLASSNPRIERYLFSLAAIWMRLCFASLTCHNRPSRLNSTWINIETAHQLR